ncbi:hypothetical protein KP509_14G000900 [Ceratopteris richardii]|uniref:Protein ARV n=1 Tax=Ceratopteris richardii TaxID=49495 RepID=A0A8T2TA29_CERRI|nr:hypothetical protein KP509_14G000900 [Ceratopteris richardii]KAH7414594.1 hypothetical protein KP509_14G000900 [Ceratopteris richardii]
MTKDGLRNPMCCVHCGTTVNEVYVQYSPGNIRLTKCVECKCVADEYVECEMMIILIDLILHKPEAYRHLFFNYPNLNKLNMKVLIWKTCLLFLLLDSCRQSFMSAGKKVDTIKWDSLTAFVSTAGKLFGQVLLQNVIYLITIMMASYITLQRYSHSTFRWGDLLLALLFSSYFKLFTFAMMVWDFSPFMVQIVEMFVLSSNTIAVKVITSHSTLISAIVVALGALARLSMVAFSW